MTMSSISFYDKVAALNIGGSVIFAEKNARPGTFDGVLIYDSSLCLICY